MSIFTMLPADAWDTFGNLKCFHLCFIQKVLKQSKLLPKKSERVLAESRRVDRAIGGNDKFEEIWIRQQAHRIFFPFWPSNSNLF